MTVREYTFSGGPLDGHRLAFGGDPPDAYRFPLRYRPTRHTVDQPRRTAVYTRGRGLDFRYDRTE